MNPGWKKFLLDRQARFSDTPDIEFPYSLATDRHAIYALPHFSVLTVTGQDAAQFLQGQLTCDLNQISESKASLGAFCNPKGRAIATFLLTKANDTYRLLLPSDLLETVRTKLSRYIFRADVTLTGSSGDCCLLGLTVAGECDALDLPKQTWETRNTSGCIVKLPSALSRFLVIADTQTAIGLWSKLTDNNLFQPQNSQYWRVLDILDGLPWLSTATSEEYIPQMLNLDTLGGISFTKGCYTGQEIIARTRYLGKSKRALYLIKAGMTATPSPNAGILDRNGQTIGKVLHAQQHSGYCQMLAVLSMEQLSAPPFTLDDEAKTEIKITEL